MTFEVHLMVRVVLETDDEFEAEEGRPATAQDAIVDGKFLLTDVLDRGMNSAFNHKFEAFVANSAEVVGAVGRKI